VKHGMTGYHVPSRDPEALAARIYELLANKDCRQLLGQQARDYAQQYAWPKIVNRMMAVYEEVVSGELVA